MDDASAAQTTATAAHPPAEYSKERMICEPHCWSVHVIPVAVKVHESTRGTEAIALISSPARTWYARSTASILLTSTPRGWTRRGNNDHARSIGRGVW